MIGSDMYDFDVLIINNQQILVNLFFVSEVKCECKPGYAGDGFSCTGNLLQILESTPTFSNFLTVSLFSAKSQFKMWLFIAESHKSNLSLFSFCHQMLQP